jgi:HD-like signal output (HDOD) protein
MTPGAEGPTSAAAFEFVRQLADELSSGQVELPSFPEVAMRVQRVLADEGVAVERVVRVIGAEPALATRVLRMANSAALNPGGRPVADLRAAVARLGFDMLRSAAITFAMTQLRRAEAHKGIEQPLNELWQRSVLVATTSFVVARRAREISADTALLAGLLHNVGRLYIMTRAARHPRLFEDTARYSEVVRDWHAQVAKALLESWGVAEELVEAIYAVESGEFVPRGAASVADVLSVAQDFASFREQPELLASRIAESRCAVRLGVEPGQVARLLEESRTELLALHEALGG